MITKRLSCMAMEGCAKLTMPAAGVRVVSRRMVRPSSVPDAETVHLTPWDLQMLTIDYIQKGVLLPQPPAGAGEDDLVARLASSLARALGRFYPFAGRLAVEEKEGGRVSVSLHCTGEGAEFVHAVAPGVAAADVATSLYVPRLVWSFFPLGGLVGADAAAAGSRRPVLAAQVTELADGGVFVAMSLNHCVADGTAFWHLFNTWSEMSRVGAGVEISKPPPALERWFLPGTRPVPIPLPFAKLEHIIRRFERPLPVEECFFHFSAERVQSLKARANTEAAGAGSESEATLSSLQSLLAHTWRAVSRARRLPPTEETTYTVLVGCRDRVKGVPRDYAGNAVVRATARSTAEEILGHGLGWTARLLNRAVASSGDEAAVRGFLGRWAREPRFAYLAGFWNPAMVVTGNSPRFDAFGNDFGWGAPVAVRSGGANKVDGRVTVYEGRGGRGSMALEVCLAPEALARLVADDEFV